MVVPEPLSGQTEDGQLSNKRWPASCRHEGPDLCPKRIKRAAISDSSDDDTLRAFLFDHAQQVSKPGVWLELLDCFLYALTAGVDLRLVINEETLREVSVATFVKEALPDLQLRFDSADGPQWLVVLTPASLAPWEGQNVRHLNHWMPAFRVGRHDGDAWTSYGKQVLDEQLDLARLAARELGCDLLTHLESGCKVGN